MRKSDSSPKATSAREQRQRIQVISRAAAILRTLKDSPDGLSLGEIAKEVDLPRSTVQRIVDALDRESLVLASSIQRGVRLGPAILSLAASTRFEIRELARDTMQALAKETGETVDLSIADNDKVVFVDQIIGKNLLTVSAVGGSFLLHSSANGKAVLAAYDEATFSKLKKRLRLPARTKNTITSWPELEKDLARTRETGIAYDREENNIGISAVACAFRTPNDEYAALSIPVPTLRFAANEEVFARTLLAHCEALRQQMAR